ncbi:unnamed protein product [Closterium sp. NIES-54]
MLLSFSLRPSFLPPLFCSISCSLPCVPRFAPLLTLAPPSSLPPPSTHDTAWHGTAWHGMGGSEVILTMGFSDTLLLFLLEARKRRSFHVSLPSHAAQPSQLVTRPLQSRASPLLPAPCCQPPAASPLLPAPCCQPPAASPHMLQHPHCHLPASRPPRAPPMTGGGGRGRPLLRRAQAGGGAGRAGGGGDGDSGRGGVRPHGARQPRAARRPRCHGQWRRARTHW